MSRAFAHSYVQHLYFACLDEGKIKNTELCLPGVCFYLPEINFFSVKNINLIKPEEQTPQWLKIGLISVALVSLRSRLDATCPEKPQLWSSRGSGSVLLLSSMKRSACASVSSGRCT